SRNFPLGAGAARIRLFKNRAGCSRSIDKWRWRMTKLDDDRLNPYEAPSAKQQLPPGKFGQLVGGETPFARTRLSLMMFLEFFIWGAWYPLIFGYLPAIGFNNNQQTMALACFNVAAIVAMFFSTQFADRNFAAERFLAFSQLIGGIAMIGLATTRSFWPFFAYMLVHCLFYVPTISITNSIAFPNV